MTMVFVPDRAKLRCNTNPRKRHGFEANLDFDIAVKELGLGCLFLEVRSLEICWDFNLFGSLSPGSTTTKTLKAHLLSM